MNTIAEVRPGLTVKWNPRRSYYLIDLVVGLDPETHIMLDTQEARDLADALFIAVHETNPYQGSEVRERIVR